MMKGKPHLKIFLGAPSEILAPVTPGESQGTKFFGSKFCSYHPHMILFYVFLGLVLQKRLENPKNIIFALLWGKMMKITTFLHFVAFFGKTNPKNT